MSDLWAGFVHFLVTVWHAAQDWYLLVVLGAALLGVVVVVIEVHQFTKRAKERRNG
ncbi:hypothetical protein [Glycomyces sp. NPDC021274]|uniref:hypothetical protein n=1 Tax=Glycomyces sp. NPDC021274 TaxID=3155120 RepID=UPI0034035460